MANPVIVRFQVEGVAQVQAAFRTVEQAVTNAEKGQSQSQVRESKERVRIAKDEAKQKILSAKEEFDKKLGLSKEETRQIASAAKQQARDQVNAVKEVDRIQAGISRDRVRREKQEAKEIADEKVRQLQREIDARRRSQEHFARTMGGAAASGAASGIRRSASLGVGLVNSVLSAGGGFDVANAFQRSVTLSGMVGDIANSGYNQTSNDPRNRVRQSTAGIDSNVRGVATRFGFQEEDVASGLRNFTKVSGDLAGGQDMLSSLAELARATGTDFDDLGKAAGSLSRNMQSIQDPGERAAEVMKVLRGLAGQGQAGALELSDMPNQIPKMAAAVGNMAGSFGDNVLLMGAIGQEAMASGGAWNAQSAGTSITALSAVFGKNARRDKFQNAHIELGDEHGGKIQLRRVLTEAVVKATTSGSSPTAYLNTLFGSVFAGRAVAGFAQVASDAQSAGKDPKAAVEAAFDKYINDAMMSEAKVRELAAERMKSNDMVLAVAGSAFRTLFAEKIVPKLMELLPAIESMTPVFIEFAAKAIPAFKDILTGLADFASSNHKIIEDLMSHPIAGLIAFEISNSFAQAAVGASVTALFRTEVIGSMVSSLGAFGIAVGAAAAAAYLLANEIDKSIKKDTNAINRNAHNASDNDFFAALNNVDAGPMTKERLAEANRRRALMDAQVQKEGDDSVNHNWTATETIGGILSSDAESSISASRGQLYQHHVEDLKKMSEAIQEATKRLKQMPLTAGTDISVSLALANRYGPVVPPLAGPK